MEHNLRALAAICVTAFAVSACDAEPRTPQQAEPEWAVSFRWTADSMVDLDEQEAVHVRAAIESNAIAEFLEMENGYPGWTDFPGAVDLDARRPEPARSAIGTAHLRLMRLDNPAGFHTFLVCKDMTQVAVKSGDLYPLPDPADDHRTYEAISIHVLAAGLSPTGSRKSDPTTAPPGPRIDGPIGRVARPEQNVFLFPVQVYYPHGTKQNRSVCESWDRWKPGMPITRSETEPPQIEPFTPGWKPK